MKLEKINDNQFRCTLTSEDLASRRIKLSELAYGTEKAKALFQDMMHQAHTEFGFDTSNSPLMIEAVPVFPDSIVLIITKVDDPEELDTRFSKFSPAAEEMVKETAERFTGADDILDLFHKICSSGKQAEQKASAEEADTPVPEETAASSDNSAEMIQSFFFAELDDVIDAAHSLRDIYNGKNSLYKNELDHSFQLVLHSADTNPENFNKICNILSEYGRMESMSAAGEACYLEHRTPFLADNALQQLSLL